MATTTTKGIPIPQTTDNNAVVTDMTNLAQWVDDERGPLTTTQRNALSTAAKWLGREIYNSTTKQKEWWDGAAWQVTGFIRGEIRWVTVDVVTPPVGWLAANGQAVSRTTYADLFALYNAQSPALPYGSGNGSTTFNVPDLRGRGMLGLDNMGGASDAAVLTTANTLGLPVGEEKHTLSVGELATHTHGYTDPTHNHLYSHALDTHSNFTGVSDVSAGGNHIALDSSSDTTSAQPIGISINNNGSSTPHNVVHPSLMLNALVKY